MNVNIKNYDFKKSKSPYKQNFKGNLTRNIKSIKLTSDELSQVSSVGRKIKQMDMLFQSSCNYIKELLTAGAGFLAALTSGFMIKNALTSDDVQNVKLNRDGDSMSFTINGENTDDVAKIVVSDSGQAEIIVDDELSDKELNKYIGEIDKNHSKFFDVVSRKINDAFNSIGLTLNKEPDSYEFDLNSKDDVKRVAAQFVDEKRKLSLLNSMVDGSIFLNNFHFEEDMPKSVDKGELKDENIFFKFSHLENKYFKGFQITIIDKNNNTRQGIVAMNDGNIYKSKLHNLNDPSDTFFPGNDWKIRNLQSLSPEEIQNPLLKRMFEYGYSHVDRVTRFFLNYIYEQNKNYEETYDTLSSNMQNSIINLEKSRFDKINKYNERIEKTDLGKTARNKEIDDKQLMENSAKIVKIYDLKPDEFEFIKKISVLNERISAANYGKPNYQKVAFKEKFNVIRRRFQNGLIYKDILNTDKFYLGVARYMYGFNGEEELNFGIFDKKLKELARFKITQNGKMKMLVKPNTTVEDSEEIEKIMKNELENGLAERLYSHMDMGAYYLENTAKVNSYVAKSYNRIGLLDAIKEMMNGKKYYKFDTDEYNSLIDTILNIKKIYRTLRLIAYRLEKLYYPEIPQKSKYAYGRIDKYNLNYEISLIDNAHISGLRILTRDKNNNFENCYIIDNNGMAYKLIKVPQNNRYEWLVNTQNNLTQLDEDALKKEHLDLMYAQIRENAVKYNGFLEEYSKLDKKERNKLSSEQIIEIINKYKNNQIDANTALQEISTKSEKVTSQNTSDTNADKTSFINMVASAPKKRGRPRKNPIELKKSLKKPTKETPKTYINKQNINKELEQKSQVGNAAFEQMVNPHDQGKQVVINSVDKRSIQINTELQNHCKSMLKSNGEFKDFDKIVLKDVVEQLDRIFATPVDKRSPHLIHEQLNSGRISEARFSVNASDGAVITVSRILNHKFDYTYYSITVKKDNMTMHINIDIDDNMIIKSHENKPILGKNDTICYEDQTQFMAKNPLAKNMPMYFMEIFEERPDVERQIIPFQKADDKNEKLMKQKMKDIQIALSTPIAHEIQKELEEDID